MKHLLALTCMALSVSISAPASAAYPEKPIEVIVAFAPGGGTDVAARSIARYMEKHLGSGAKLAIINKPGAGGEIGWSMLAHAKPDGYTIGMINPPAFVALAVEGKAKYTMESFTPIGNIVLDPGILVVGKDSPYNSLQDIMAAAKSTPEAIVVGISGAAGSSEHIGLLNLNHIAKVSFTPAFFGSTAPVRQALLGGHIPAATMNLSEALPLIRSGDIKILGVMSEQRSSYLPDAPTFAEAGYDLIVTASRGLAAPAGVPADIVQKLEVALKDAMNDPEYLKAAQQAEIPLTYLNSADYTSLISKIHASLAETWKVMPWR